MTEESKELPPEKPVEKSIWEGLNIKDVCSVVLVILFVVVAYELGIMDSFRIQDFCNAAVAEGHNLSYGIGHGISTIPPR